MDIALRYGFWVFGGYVRDVIVRGETSYTDIDIGCTWEQMNLVPKFIEEVGGEITYDTFQATGRTQHKLFPYVRRILHVKTRDESIDIIVFSNFKDFLNHDCVSCNMFYMTRDGLFMKGNFTQKDVDYYAQLTLQKRFVILAQNSINFECAKTKLLAKGWSEVFNGV